MDALASDVILPIEILREFVLWDPSPSSLARWCRVGSHDLLALAGRLLYKTVTLRKADDVIPFIKRLFPQPPPSPHLALDGITRIEFLELPDTDSVLELYKDKGHLPPPSNSLALAVQWPTPSTSLSEVEITMIFLPLLIALLNPTSCEEMGEGVDGKAPVVLAGVYLSTFHRISFGSLPNTDHPRLDKAYSYCTTLYRTDKIFAETVAEPLFQRVRNFSNEVPSFKDLADRLDDVKDRMNRPFDYTSVNSVEELRDRMVFADSVMDEWQSALGELKRDVEDLHQYHQTQSRLVEPSLEE